MKKLLVFLAVPFAASCTNEVLVVHDNNSTAASFTVIPYVTIPANAIGGYQTFRDDDKDVEFAASVEREISQHGLKILERPVFRFQETTVVGDGSGQGKEKSTQTNRLLDVVSMYADTPADYIAVTYENSRRVRIIKKQDKSLVATVQLNSSDPAANADKFHSMLVAANLLKDSWSVSKCQTTKN